MSHPYDYYVSAAVNALGYGALPTQQQTLTLALTMAICDLIKKMEEKRSEP